MENASMELRVSEVIQEGDLVCIGTGGDGASVLLRWRYGCEAIGVAARTMNVDEVVEFSPGVSSAEITVKGSASPAENKVVSVRAACDLKNEDLVCIRLHEDGQLEVDKWQYGEEAVGIAARDIRCDEVVAFCSGRSTPDIHVKPHG